MKATVDFVTESFNRFNTLILAGRLPLPVITLCDATSFVAQYRRNKDGSHQLRFSTAFSLSESELEDTVIHEMIHYFIAYHGLQDRSAHGPLFRALMQSINETHGRAISVSHRTSAAETDAAKSSKKKWHVIAILHFTDGQLGVKVLPRVIPRIIEYYNSITAATNIKRVELFLHNDPFFNRFPTSTGRRCQPISSTELANHLSGAHTLTVSGSRLLQH